MKEPSSPGLPAHWRWAILSFVLLVSIVAARHFHSAERLRAMVEWIQAQGLLAPVWFIGIYIVACVLFLPGSILTLAAGAVFGPIWGTIWASAGSTTGATASFLIGRFLARKWVAGHVTRAPRFAAIDEAVRRDGWKIVVLLRLSPLFPFVLINYGLGATRVRVRDFLLASWLGMLPATALYAYLGSLLGFALLGGKTLERRKTSLEWVFYATGLVATIVVTVVITRMAKKALSERIAPVPIGEPLSDGPASP